MASSRRLEKLNMLLKEELAYIIYRKVDFPPDIMVTVTRTEISPDMHYAAVFISVLGKDEETALDILKKNIYHIQRLLNKILRMRPVPAIRFILDEGEMRREVIEKKLAELKNDG